MWREYVKAENSRDLPSRLMALYAVWDAADEGRMKRKYRRSAHILELRVHMAVMGLRAEPQDLPGMQACSTREAGGDLGGWEMICRRKGAPAHATLSIYALCRGPVCRRRARPNCHVACLIFCPACAMFTVTRDDGTAISSL